MDIHKVLKNIHELKNNSLKELYSDGKKINQKGDSLEIYVKDAFCGSFDERSKQEKENIYGKMFSYEGTASRPPDFMTRGGDAFEVKKVESEHADIQLNSSYPKRVLTIDDPKLSKKCRECEEWTVKDMWYVVGFVKNNEIKKLCFIEGACYAADAATYESYFNRLAKLIENEFKESASKTKEIGRINSIDPLGVTNLRIRPMWIMKNPIHTYEEYMGNHKERNFTCIAVMRKEKWNVGEVEGIDLYEQRIPSPNDAGKMIDALIARVSF